MVIRFRSRHLRATLYNMAVTELTTLGWVTTPINFGAQPVTVLDYQPDERNEPVMQNTVAVSLGDILADVDEELGSLGGGLRSAWVPVFIDVYMSEQAISDAICDDLRGIFDTHVFPLVDQITGLPSSEQIDIEEVRGPDRPAGATSADQFKRYWRIVRLGVRLYYNT
jgi:hypothetical protein